MHIYKICIDMEIIHEFCISLETGQVKHGGGRGKVRDQGEACAVHVQ